MTREELLAENEHLKKQVMEQEAIIRQQSVQIENMLQAILHARRERFGAKSEASVPGQLSLFTDQDLEALANALNEQKKELAVPDKKSSVAKRSGVSRGKLAGLAVEVVTCELDPREVCDVCGAPLKKVGQKIVRSEVEYIKAQVRVRQYVQSVYKCTVCGSEGSENPSDHFVSAAVPAPPAEPLYRIPQRHDGDPV